MSQHDDIAAGLPGPSADEPTDLRRDITDELADHLACATAREHRHCTDETTVRRRVLDRFGDPKRVARRLWGDAMKETIMQQRLMLGMNLLLAATCIVICIVALTAWRQNTKLAETLVTKLEAIQSAAAAGDSVWAHATVRVIRPDGNAVPRLRAQLQGQPFDVGGWESVPGAVDAEGLITFGPVRPGRYELRLGERFPTWLNHQSRVTLYPGRHELPPITWLGAPSETAPVAIDAPWPTDLREDVVGVIVRLERSPVDSTMDRDWAWSPIGIVVRPDGTVMAEHDFAKGLESLGNGTFRLRSDLRSDATVTLDTSLEYRVSDLLVLVAVDGESGPGGPIVEELSILPPSSIEQRRRGESGKTYYNNSFEPMRLDPDSATTAWHIDLPDWLIDATREHLEGARPAE